LDGIDDSLLPVFVVSAHVVDLPVEMMSVEETAVLDKRACSPYTCIMTQTSKGSDTCCSEIESLFPSGFFKALGDSNRIALMAQLATCCDSKTVSELSECCPTDLSVVSRHLATLREAGIVESEKRGREVFYRLRYDQLAGSLRQMADAIQECCPGAGEWRLSDTKTGGAE
jgi:DNA-binding transcriptional ArsR family regulator